jgi:hypothetical protein
VPNEGYKQTPEHRAKIAESKRGKKHSEETKAKQAAATAARHERKRVRRTFLQRVTEKLDAAMTLRKGLHEQGLEHIHGVDSGVRLVRKNADGSVVELPGVPVTAGFAVQPSEERDELAELQDVIAGEVRKVRRER